MYNFPRLFHYLGIKGYGVKRKPRNYDGTELTSKTMSDLLPNVLGAITRHYRDQGSLIIASWPEIIGEKLSPMTKAVSFEDGILTVHVANSTLHSLLSGHERGKLLHMLQKKFPSVNIRNIIFRIG